MSNKSLVQKAQYKIVHSDSVTGTAGRAMVVASIGGFGLMALAAILPISLFWVCVVMFDIGVLIAD